jgi:uncharacterized membrane protein YoaK (UPF0700 family)
MWILILISAFVLAAYAASKIEDMAGKHYPNAKDLLPWLLIIFLSGATAAGSQAQQIETVAIAGGLALGIFGYTIYKRRISPNSIS